MTPGKPSRTTSRSADSRLGLENIRSYSRERDQRGGKSLVECTVSNLTIGVETEKWSLVARGENITDAELPLSTATIYRRVDPDTFELEFTWRLR